PLRRGRDAVIDRGRRLEHVLHGRPDARAVRHRRGNITPGGPADRKAPSRPRRGARPGDAAGMNPTPPRFGVLINPTAGHGRGRRLGWEALAELERRALHVVDLSHPTPEGAFTGAVQRQGEYDVLIVVGGDG